MILGQVGASASDPLLSPEHGILAAVATVLALLGQFIQAKIRSMRRGSSLRDEVRSVLIEESDAIVEKEVARQMGLRAYQDGDWRMRLDGNVENLTNKLDEIEAGQEQTTASVGDVNKQLNHMRLGIYKLVAAMKPELVADLDLGTPS